jgi:hypothetical protein
VVPRSDERVDLLGDVETRGGLASLVIDDRRTGACGGQADHGADKVGAVDAIKPGGADHVCGIEQLVGERRPLAG